MYVIGLNPGVTPSQMSGALGLDAVQTALMLNALEERGLLVRRLSRTDGRSRLVHLTPAGKAFEGELKKAARVREQRFVSSLDVQERAQASALLHKLVAAVPHMNKDQ